MKGNLRFIVLIFFTCSLAIQLHGQTGYSDSKSVSRKLSKLAADYPKLCSIKSIGRTAVGNDIMVLSIGTGDRDNKPAVAVVGGIEANYLLSKEMTVGFAEKILKDAGTDEIKGLLEKITFYVIADVSPDAGDQHLTSLRFERNTNTRQTDDDRDFSLDEDPFEDLNGDGYITMMRVTDPTGSMITSDEDNRIMVQADLSKGQKGVYYLYTEGKDNDKDGSFNEDGAGGVSFNRNFTYNYEEYGLNAGFHAVSESESKAVADFLFDHFNIYAVISFGPQDNLGQPMRASERGGGPQGESSQGQFQFTGRQTGDRRITSILKSDETINKLVSERYHEITGLKGAPSAKNNPGNFMEWAYYHYGRYSFSTPGWWYPGDKGKNPEVTFLKFAEENKIENPFVQWTEVIHPDFPGKKVEVGGIKPFLMINPPEALIDDLITKHYKFVTTLASMHPELELTDVRSESLGDNITRISLKVHNKGVFATCAEVGENNQWTRIMRIALEPAAGQTLLSGAKIQRIRRLEGDQSAEFSWLISGKGDLKISAGALNTGTVSVTLELK